MQQKMEICQKLSQRKAKKNDMPVGTAVINGIVASIVLLLAPILPNQDLFWSFFALNLVMFLLAYIPVFPAFYKLRKIDPDKERPFKVSGSDTFLKILVVIPMILLVISIIFTGVPLSFDAETLAGTLPITIGAIICIFIGELIIIVKKIK